MTDALIAKSMDKLILLSLMIGMSIALSSCCLLGGWGCRHHRGWYCDEPIRHDDARRMIMTVPLDPSIGHHPS